jgi:methylated-DNA-[protein]-cysteine S-methyltransferase
MGQRMTDFFIETFATPIGSAVTVTDEEGQLRALDWDDRAPSMHRLLRLHYGRVRLQPTGAASTARRAVEAYFDGELTAIDSLPVKTGGTPFQRSVWAALRTIPTGKTTTYGRIAVGLSQPKAVRAVGMANGANPISIVVPCHRVIGADAALTGYGGGLERKRWLLQHEGVDC